MNWPSARAAAETMFYGGYRGHLATVTSADENQFVRSYTGAGGPVSDMWLGGYQDTTAPDYREPDGGWRWVTGEPWNYTSWNGGEPNNAGGAENFLEGNSGGGWNDLSQGAGLDAYLVEYEPAPVPGPPRLGILPNPVVGGMTTVGQVTLDRPAAPGDVMVALGSSDPTVAAVPWAVIVPAGESTALFYIVTAPVPAPTTVMLSAASAGGVRSTPLRVLPVGAAFPPGNLLVNGSFEQPHLTAPVLTTDLPGWRITQGSVDIVYGWQQAPGQGSQSLDLVGDGGDRQHPAGTIEQTVPTVAGRDYLFSGWMAHNFGNPVAQEGRANVALNGQFFVQLFHRYEQASQTDMGWVHFAYRFHATTAATTLAIADVTGTWDKGGLALDGLAITPVQPNLLVNGSFEEPDLGATGEAFRNVDSNGLPGWLVPVGTVAVVHRRSWQPAPDQGDQVLHLLGQPGAGGVIEQTIATDAGRLYTLSGWVSHHPAILEGRVNVYVDSDLLTQLYHSSDLYGAETTQELRWQPFLYAFRATGTSTTLQFVDATGLSATEGAALDGLVVAPEEEPMPGGQPPAAPTGLAVRLISPTQVDLTWTDNGGGETGFEIQRRTGTGEWTRIALVAANVTRFSDFGVAPNTSYTYRVRAVNDSGNSDWSNEAGVTTLAGP